MTKRLRNNNGIVYITALAMMLMFITYGLVLSTVTQKDVQVSQNTFKMLRDFYSAEAGLEHALGDIHNGGTGEVDVNDLYTDNAGRDYQTTYDLATNTITSYSSYLEGTNRQVRAQVAGTTRALIAGSELFLYGSNGIINGDFEHGGLGASTIEAGLTITGRFIQHEASIKGSIPYPVLSDYADIADYVYPGNVTFDTSNPPPVPINNGIIYSTGSIAVKGTDITITGTLVAQQGVDLNGPVDPCHNLTIVPYLPHYPAVIAQGSVTIAGINDVNINGLVYGSTVMINNSANLNINGAVVAYFTLLIGDMTNLSVTYNPLLNMPHFAIDGDKVPVKITNWIGHGPM